MKVGQEVREAHRRRATDRPQQPGPAHPSWTQGPFPTALSELVRTMQEPRRPRCNPDTSWGGCGGASQGWGPSPWGKEREGGRAEIPVPQEPHLEIQSQGGRPTMYGKPKGTKGERKVGVPQTCTHVTQSCSRGEGEDGEGIKKKPPLFIIRFHI